MLKGISPLITPELLKVLAEMGHDDALLLADANFTAMSLGVGKPIIRLPGTQMGQVVQAVLQLLPLAADVAHPVAYMQVEGKPADYQSALQREITAQVQMQILPQQSCQGVERFAFYERVQKCYAIVLTGELQPYGNFILRKGVIGEILRT